MSYECLDQLKMKISIQKLDNKAGLIFDPHDRRNGLLHELQNRNFVLALFQHIEDYETIEKLFSGPLDFQHLLESSFDLLNHFCITNQPELGNPMLYWNFNSNSKIMARNISFTEKKHQREEAKFKNLSFDETDFLK